MTGTNKSITEPQKVAPVDVGMPKDYLEKRSVSPRQGRLKPHMATGACSFQYYSIAAALNNTKSYIIVPGYKQVKKPKFVCIS